MAFLGHPCCKSCSNRTLVLTNVVSLQMLAAHLQDVQHTTVLQVGNYIQHKGGVVTAEELAPYMDVPQAGKDPETLNDDESYVMPALVRFNGSAEVDKNNNIIYRFPTLQKTGRRQVGLPVCSLHCSTSPS